MFEEENLEDFADLADLGIVDVVVAAAVKDVDEVAAGVAMEKDVPHTGTYLGS